MLLVNRREKGKKKKKIKLLMHYTIHPHVVVAFWGFFFFTLYNHNFKNTYNSYLSLIYIDISPKLHMQTL